MRSGISWDQLFDNHDEPKDSMYYRFYVGGYGMDIVVVPRAMAPYRDKKTGRWQRRGYVDIYWAQAVVWEGKFQGRFLDSLVRQETAEGKTLYFSASDHPTISRYIGTAISQLLDNYVIRYIACDNPACAPSIFNPLDPIKVR